MAKIIPKSVIRHRVGGVTMTVTRFDDGWTFGTATFDSTPYLFSMKNFLIPSQFGINNGCISKLSISRGNDLNWIVNYDRGWDIRPKGDDIKTVYKALLELFNDTMPEDCLPYWKKSVGMADTVKTARPKTKKKENLPFGL